MDDDLGEVVGNILIEEGFPMLISRPSFNEMEHWGTYIDVEDAYDRAKGIAGGFLFGNRHVTDEGFLMPDHVEGIGAILGRVNLNLEENLVAMYDLVQKATDPDISTERTGVQIEIHDPEGVHKFDVGARHRRLYVPELAEYMAGQEELKFYRSKTG